MAIRYAHPDCGGLFKIEKNGVSIMEKMPRGDEPNVTWLPYKLYLGDLYRCAKCGTTLAVASNQAYAEHYEPNFEQKVWEATEYKGLIHTEGC